MHDTIVTCLGDNDISSKDIRAKIDLVLRFYSGSPQMCISNEHLKEGKGNGSLCKCVKIRLKKNGMQQWKYWEGKKVWTVSAKDVDYMSPLNTGLNLHEINWLYSSWHPSNSPIPPSNIP
jgi:hypothetical protein